MRFADGEGGSETRTSDPWPAEGYPKPGVAPAPDACPADPDAWCATMTVGRPSPTEFGFDGRGGALDNTAITAGGADRTVLGLLVRDPPGRTEDRLSFVLDADLAPGSLLQLGGNAFILDEHANRGAGVYQWRVPAGLTLAVGQKITVRVDTPAALKDATLSGLELTDADDSAVPIALDPAFDPDTHAYTATVTHRIDSITVTPTAAGGAVATLAHVDANGAPVDDADANAPGHQADLAVGENAIRIKVTAGDGSTTATYTVTVTRQAAVNLPATGKPAISGTAQEGETLSADLSAIDDGNGLPTDPAAFAYRWLRIDGATRTPIAGATAGTYTPTADDVGKRIGVTVSFTDDGGNPESLTSDAFPGAGLAVVDARPPCPDDADWCATMTVGSWHQPGVGTLYGYVRNRYDSAMTDDLVTSGGATYRIIEVRQGGADNFLVAATRNERSTYLPDGWVFDVDGVDEFTTDAASRDSNVKRHLWPRHASIDRWVPGQKVTVSLNIPAVATGRPAISGVAQAGERLTADRSGIRDSDGLPTDPAAFSYQWLRVDTDGSSNPVDIPGANAETYIPTAADVGKRIKVRVSFTDALGNPETATSGPYPKRGLPAPAIAPALLTGEPEDADWCTVMTVGTGRGTHSNHHGYQYYLNTTEVARIYSGTPGGTYIPGYGSLDDYEIEHNGEIYARLMTVRLQTHEVYFLFNRALPNGTAVSLGAHSFTLSETSRSGPARSHGWQEALPAGLIATAGQRMRLCVDLPADATPARLLSIKGDADEDGGFEENATADESEDRMWFTITLHDAEGEEAAAGRAVTVRWFTRDVKQEEDPQGRIPAKGVAEHGDFRNGVGHTDYQWTGPHEVTFDPGVTTRRIQVRINDDGFPDSGEIFKVVLDHAIGAVIADPEAIGTITNHDGPVLAVADASAAEGDAVAFAVSLTEAASEPVTVAYATAGGTATGGTDFTAASGTLTFAPGETEKTVSVATTDDSDEEQDETFTLTLSDPTNAGLGTATATGTIEDDDGAAALTAAFADLPERHDESPFTFTLQFSEDVSGLMFRTLRDAAFTVTGGRVTAAKRKDQASNRGWDITVEPEGPGEVGILLPETTNCGAPGAICDRDGRMLSGAVSATVPGLAPLTASFSEAPDEHDGSSAFTLTLTFSEAPDGLGFRTVRDSLFAVTGGRIARARRTAQGSNRGFLLTLEPAGNAAVTLALATPLPDCGQAGAVCTADGRKLTGPVTATVQGPPALSVADAEADEGPGAALDFKVTLSRAASGPVTVDYATADGSATAGSDYTAASGTLAFSAGETEKTVSVPVLDDAHDDDGETLTLTLSNPAGAWIDDATATGTIRNTDHMPQAWLARFGRTVAEQVIAAVESRIAAAPRPGIELTLAGERIGGNAAPEGAAAEEARKEARAQAEMKRLSDWLRGETEDRKGERDRSRAVTPREIMTGSSFALTAEADGMGGGAVSLWGRGAQASFSGRADTLSVSGEVTSAMLGADWTRERWTAGLMLTHARGAGSYRGAANGEAAGAVSSTLTGIFPYGATRSTTG